jgi:8-oxo-dGTP pyrophosphatase MutT (NUDIX family)
VSAEQGPRWRKERWPITTSIAIFLRPDPRSSGLILVRNTDQWGLPAGGLEKNELLLEGIVRELREETGILPGRIFFEKSQVEFPEEATREPLVPSFVVCLPGEDRTQLGLIFEAVYHGPKLSWNGWPVDGDEVEKIKQAKPFRIKDLLKLLDEHLNNLENGGQGTIYKPEFNYHLLLNYIINVARIRGKPKQSDYIMKWTKKNKERIPGIVREMDFLFGGEFWVYLTPWFERQSDEVIKRKAGLKWGE